MRKLVFALPGDPETLTGGYIYDKRLIAGLRELGWDVELLRLPEVLGQPAAIPRAEQLLGGLPRGVPAIVDGLALGVLPGAAAAVAARGALVALVHHPLAEETGVAPAAAAALRESERAALAWAAVAIATSATTARSLTEAYGVPAARVSVARPGVDPAPLSDGTGSPVALLSVGTLTPRKGHAVLLGALERISATNWHLTLVGSDQRDTAEAKRIRRLAANSRHCARLCLAGEVDAGTLARLFHEADLFVLPSYHEGYGMAFAEALARGVPVVATCAGALPETVPPAAGRLVSPGDVGALAEELRRLIAEPQARAALRAGAVAARADLPSWRDTAASVSDLLESLA